VLDRVHAHRAFANRRGAVDCLQVLDFRIDRRLILQIFALEFDSVIDRRRLQFERDLFAGMQGGARKAGSFAKCLLKFRRRGHL
jgi:hypothetical protein